MPTDPRRRPSSARRSSGCSRARTATCGRGCSAAANRRIRSSVRSSDRSAPPIALEPRPPTVLRIARLVLLGLAVGAVNAARMPMWAIHLVSLAMIGYGWFVDRAIQRMGRVRLALRGDGSWLAREHGSDVERVLSLREHAVLGPLVAMAFADAGVTAHRLVLLPGDVGAETERALRAWLRHGYHGPAAGPPEP